MIIGFQICSTTTITIIEPVTLDSSYSSVITELMSYVSSVLKNSDGFKYSVANI